MNDGEDIKSIKDEFKESLPGVGQAVPSPPPPPPSSNTIEHVYGVANSAPLLGAGRCRACKTTLRFPELPFDDNSGQSCPFCGAVTPRLESIRGILSAMDMTTWSLLSSDKYTYDSGVIQHGQIISYNNAGGAPVQFAKWLRYDAFLTEAETTRYEVNPVFLDSFAYLFLRDTWSGTPPPDPLPVVKYSWFRYGLSSVGAVPAWRQALFGAVTLVQTNPAASVVLIAAGFEAFFIETMRIAWQQKGLDSVAFRRLDRNPLTSLVEWLPVAVGLPSLIDAPQDLHGRWRNVVNQRRNDVMHRADVQVTSEQAQESLEVALETITFLDQFALTRPHAYFVGQ